MKRTPKPYINHGLIGTLTYGLTILLSLFSYAAWAQKPDAAIARVNYKFTHIDDTTQRDNPHTELMLLVVGNNASVFTSLDKINTQKELETSMQKQIKEQAGAGSYNFTLSSPINKPTTNIDIYKFANEKKLYVNESLILSYLIEDKHEPIQWKILKDTASFLGVKCQKATANFKGRNWTAWFSTDYPMSSGPWKLSGLPGLIIQAYDSKNEVKFEFEGIELVKQNASDQSTGSNELGGPGNVRIVVGLSNRDFDQGVIKLPANATIISQKDLDRLKEIREKDPAGFQKSQMASMPSVTGARATMGGVDPSQIKSITVTKGTATSSSTKKARVLNNPIELPQKK